ncbi:hypothetical protein Goklo_008125 [Gossypium klotzschianum]|uniref:Uncharacterized protein n=1 Tax=Gossypium klotzschianum TaxID=34286 RepID=A0A7J8UYS5_9ROSI|nr:hypothetical protein [Gossypium klotzschianum]
MAKASYKATLLGMAQNSDQTDRMEEINTMWKPLNPVQLMDLEKDFYLVYQKAITPNFLLRAIRQAIGPVVKLDTHIDFARRGNPEGCERMKSSSSDVGNVEENLVNDDGAFNGFDKSTEQININENECDVRVSSIKGSASPRRNKSNAKGQRPTNVNFGLNTSKAAGGEQIMGFQPITLTAKLDKTKHQAFRAIATVDLVAAMEGIISGLEQGHAITETIVDNPKDDE